PGTARRRRGLADERSLATIWRSRSASSRSSSTYWRGASRDPRRRAGGVGAGGDLGEGPGGVSAAGGVGGGRPRQRPHRARGRGSRSSRGRGQNSSGGVYSVLLARRASRRPGRPTGDRDPLRGAILSSKIRGQNGGTVPSFGTCPPPRDARIRTRCAAG